MRLEPCPKCERHVRVTEQSCPFCGADVKSLAALPERSFPTKRLGRAALFAFGVTAAAAVAGCSDEPDVEGDDDKDASVKDGGTRGGKDAGAPDATVAPVYGAPVFPPDATVGKQDAQVAIPAYGVPVFPPDASANDAGAADASTRRDSGGIVPLYGLAVPPNDSADNR